MTFYEKFLKNSIGYQLMIYDGVKGNTELMDEYKKLLPKESMFIDNDVKVTTSPTFLDSNGVPSNVYNYIYDDVDNYLDNMKDFDYIFTVTKSYHPDLKSVIKIRGTKKEKLSK